MSNPEIGSIITTCGREFRDELDGAREVHFQAEMKSPHGLKLEPPIFHPLLQVDPDGGHVAHDLAGGFLKRNVEATFAPAAGCRGKCRRYTRLAGACGAGQENAAPAVESLAAEHGVEPLDAGRNALERRIVFELDGSDRPDRDSILLDEKRILVRAVDGAAIFDHPDAAGRHLIDHPMIERDNAIGDVFLQAIASQRAVAALAGR